MIAKSIIKAHTFNSATSFKHSQACKSPPPTPTHRAKVILPTEETDDPFSSEG